MKTAVPLTLAGWVNLSSLATTQSILLVDDNTDNNRLELGVLLTTGVVRAITRATNLNSIALSTSGISTGVWQHIAAVFASASDRRAYANGGNKGTEATSKTPAGIARTRAGVTAGGNNQMGGSGAELAAWSVALSDAEVAVLATGISPYEVQRANLIAYWPLIGVDSPEPDVVGAFPLTLTGTPTQSAHPSVFYGKNRFRRRGLLAA